MDTFLQDIKYAVRMLSKTPGFTFIAVLTLALGIGANTTMFSVIDGVLLQSAPFRDPQRLVVVWENNSSHAGRAKTNVVSPLNYYRWREQSTSFESLGAFFSTPMNAVINGEAERLPAIAVTPSLMSTLGVNPVLGRNFAADEEQPGKDNVLSLSYDFWQQRFGGDPSIVGKDITVNGESMKIVGIMPPRFSLLENVSVWTPITKRPQTPTSKGRYMTVIGRLKPGVSVTQAQADMEVVSSHLRAETPDYNAGWGVNIVSLREQMVGKVKPALLVLLGAVAFVLLIACANVANLLLARATARRKEIAIRCALGVSRTRLARQLLTESLVLSLGGGTAGLALAYFGLQAVLALVPSAFPGYAQIRMNLTVLAFTFGICILTGILFGLAPALRATRTDPQEALKEGGKGTAAPGHQRLRNALVVAEAATSIVLLIGAGLLVRSFARLVGEDTGFKSEGVVTMQVTLTTEKYRKVPAVISYFQEAVERLKRVPGVTAAGAITYLPLAGLGSATSFTVDGAPTPKPGEMPIADVRGVTEDYFKAMGISLLRGRTFDPSQERAEDAISKIIIGRAAAELLWPGQDPLGKTITMEWGTMKHAQVIGVVNDVRLISLDKETNRTTMYWFMPQFPSGQMTLVARTRSDAKSFLPAVRSAVASLDPEVPIAKLRTMDSVVGESVREPRFSTVLLGIFAALALVLAAIGLYGVMSYSVNQRRHELGIRMALGARRDDVSKMVLGEGMLLALTGAAIGVLAAVFLVRFLGSMVYGISTHDAATFGVVPLLICSVAAVASYVPARRATRVDPLEALRYE